ncbi:MAG: hypothetical protein WD884_00760 [Nitrosopumilaceae archaeon]
MTYIISLSKEHPPKIGIMQSKANGQGKTLPCKGWSVYGMKNSQEMVTKVIMKLLDLWIQPCASAC